MATKIDKILTHKFYGVIIFIFVIWLIFQVTFGLGYYPVIWITNLVFLIEDGLIRLLPAGMIKSLLVNGILRGIGGVIVFLPNIVILFSLLSLMEESGYLSRVTMVMDRVMRPLGLSGRSFISLVMGFGCNVPAIMAAKEIENKNSRLITILINPLMSCSSRFTVYVLFISAFFPHHGATVLFCIYVFSVLLATLMSIILKKFVFKGPQGSQALTLRPYRLPSLKRILKSMWYNSKLFLNKISGAILIASVVIWILSYFPDNKEYKNIDKSYIGMVGKYIEPAIAPLGFDWKMGVSLISGIAAKETVVGILSQLYQDGHKPGDDKQNLIVSLNTQVYQSGKKKGERVFNPAVALSFMFFVSIYTPCVATISTVRKTTGSRKWTVFVIAYTSILAWVVAFAVFQIGSLFL